MLLQFRPYLNSFLKEYLYALKYCQPAPGVSSMNYNHHLCTVLLHELVYVCIRRPVMTKKIAPVAHARVVALNKPL
jgi:hypothetical protein